jgi:hypothetical protein
MIFEQYKYDYISILIKINKQKTNKQINLCLHISFRLKSKINRWPVERPCMLENLQFSLSLSITVVTLVVFHFLKKCQSSFLSQDLYACSFLPKIVPILTTPLLTSCGCLQLLVGFRLKVIAL